MKPVLAIAALVVLTLAGCTAPPEELTDGSLTGQWVLVDVGEEHQGSDRTANSGEPDLRGTFSLGADGIWTTPVCGDQSGRFSYTDSGAWAGDGGRLTYEYCEDDPMGAITAATTIQLVDGVLSFYGQDGELIRSAVRV